MRTLFDLCVPRDDVRTGGIRESEFAADLAQVLRGEAPREYQDPATFFANTHPTEGLKRLLENVCRRLSGQGGEASAIYRLDTQYGGGKTHALIALAHAATHGGTVPTIAEFVDPALLPAGPVRVAAFDGENADPVNGRAMGGGVRAYTPWGELACALAGPTGYESIRKSVIIEPLADREYKYSAPGMREPLRVTTDPEYFDQHASSVELWSPGSPLFPAPEEVSGATGPDTSRQSLGAVLDQVAARDSQ